MKAYIVSFRKADGSIRKMLYAKIKDLPSSFISDKFKGTGKQKTLSEGREVVWDLEKKSFRVVNHNSLIGNIVEVEIDESDLN
jgi:hypothetical protein